MAQSVVLSSPELANLNTLEPGFRSKALNVLNYCAALGTPFQVSDCLRDAESQAWLCYVKKKEVPGFTAAEPGFSKHEYGYAIDVNVMIKTVDNRYIVPEGFGTVEKFPQHWINLQDACAKYQCQMIASIKPNHATGGYITKGTDFNHFEDPVSISSLRYSYPDVAAAGAEMIKRVVQMAYTPVKTRPFNNSQLGATVVVKGGKDTGRLSTVYTREGASNIKGNLYHDSLGNIQFDPLTVENEIRARGTITYNGRESLIEREALRRIAAHYGVPLELLTS